MKLARTRNTVRNTYWGLIYRLVTLIGPFIVRTLIINELGIEYSGLSSLFTSILTVLNLSNLGFSSSIVFTMYKAIAEDDIEAQCSMINYYRKVYKIVGVVILILGLAVMPFLPHLVEGDVPSNINLYSLFALYLFETTLDYFLFAYTTAIFTAYQRNDITLKISTVRYAIQYTLQAVVLILFHDYYIYIIILPIMVIPNNIANYILSRREYPFIKCKGTLDPVTKHDILIRVGTLFGHKVGSTVLVGIDSIIVSAFLGLTTMGLYGNYYYILTAVNALVEIVTNGVLSGIGNKLVLDSEEENFRLFNTLTFGWIFLISWAANAMMCLYQPFIGGIWFDESYLLNIEIVALIVLYFYSWMFRLMQLTYRDAAGLWTKDWLKPYIAMAINISLSIVMVKATGSIMGVLVPTIIIFFFIYTPWESWVLFKYLFKHNSNTKYLLKLLGYSIASIFDTILSYCICNYLSPNNSLLSVFLRFFILSAIQFVFWTALFSKSQDFRECLRITKRIITRKKY